MYVSEMMQQKYEMSPYARFLQKHDLKSTAVLYKNMNETLMRRTARAVRYLLEETEIPHYQPGQVVLFDSAYPAAQFPIAENKAVYVNADGDVVLDEAAFEAIAVESEYEASLKQVIYNNAKNMSSLKCTMRYVNHGNHTSVDYEYILQHGLRGYRAKIQAQLETLTDETAIDFQHGMLDVLDGIECYMARYLASLKAIVAPDAALQALIAALEVVPLNPPTNFYQAYTMMFVPMFFANSLEPARIDQLLYPYYLQDESVDREKAFFYIRTLFEEIEKRMPHPGSTHATIGGSYADGSAVYNELTELCVLAIRGLRAPNVSLCVRDDMPQSLWDCVMENIGKGYTQPALVNDSLYIEGFVNEYNIPREEAVKYVFGGCSEVLIQGKTHCDAVWAGYNMLDVFEDTLYNHFVSCQSYQEFYDIYKRYMKVTLRDMVAQTNMREFDNALHHTCPIRSLFVSDCIERSKSFTDGGTKYNFSSAAFFGASNTFNAMYTVKRFFEGYFGDMPKQAFLAAFAENFSGHEEMYQQCLHLPKFGNFNDELNEIAADLMQHGFQEIKKHRGVRGECFYLPTMIFWITWLKMGKTVGATPDGRVAGQPLADSVGATQGTDKEGPTAALGAALHVPQKECVGTCVFNMRLDAANFKTPELRLKTQILLATYLQQGGCQLQISVVDKAVLEDALIHPEQHGDIIVRVGGFSDNFIYLSDEIKEQVIRRIEL